MGVGLCGPGLAGVMAGMNADDYLTDYERAIFYYSLPRLRTPFPIGVTIVYGVVMALAAATLVYGVATGEPDWLRAGGIGLGFGVVVGGGAFVLRDFMNQVRERAALKSAKGIPDADSQFDDIPDPFGEHVLLRYPTRHSGNRLSVENNKGEELYVSELESGGAALKFSDADGTPLFEATLGSSSQSFASDRGSPRRIVFGENGEKTGEMRRRSSLGPSAVEIERQGDNGGTYRFFGGGLYEGEALVGRMYEVRGHRYLDILKSHLSNEILGFFVTIG